MQTFCRIEEFANRWNQAIYCSMMLFRAHDYTVHTQKFLAANSDMAVVICSYYNPEV